MGNQPQKVATFYKWLLLIVFSCYGSVSLCQQTVTSLSTIAFEKAPGRKIKIGEQLPELKFSMMNYPEDEIYLSDLKGKYLIFDFWATWCSSCISKFPALDSLQRKYNDKLQIILVNSINTKDNKDKIISFFNQRSTRGGQKLVLPSVVSDSVFISYFQPRSIPHYVWVDENGKVQAITSSDQINEENIRSFIAGNELRLPEKNDLAFNRNVPLFQKENTTGAPQYIYRSLLTGYQEGLPSAVGLNAQSDGLITRIYSTNVSILALYRQALKELNNFPKNRIIFQTNRKLQISDEEEWDQWKINNAYVYELIIPPATKESAKKYMLNDLKRYFNLNAVQKRERVNCLILNKNTAGSISQEGSSETNIHEKGNLKRYALNYKVQNLVNYLNTRLNIPIIDETGQLSRISIYLPDDVTDLKLLKAAFEKSGYSLSEEKREIDLFVFSEITEQ